LISLDPDEAGNREYNEFWGKYFLKSCRHNIPDKYGKDPTEGMLAGLNLYKWYLDGMDKCRV